MSSDTARSRQADYSESPETPPGIWIIAVLGLVGAVLGFLGGIAAFAADGMPFLVGIGLILLSVAQAITMLALVGLTPWAWYATILLYGISVFSNLLGGDGAGVLVSIVIIVYVATQRDLFRR